MAPQILLHSPLQCFLEQHNILLYNVQLVFAKDGYPPPKKKTHTIYDVFF